MELLVKQLEFSEEQGLPIVTGYASSTALDLQGDVITEEALKQVAEEITKDPYNKVFLNHNMNDIPIGKIVEAKVVDGKLWVKIVLNKAHEKFEQVYNSLKGGFLNAFSIGYQVLERLGNKITKLRILEVSLVSIPANPEAIVEEVKQLDVILTKGVVPGHPWKYGKDDKSEWKKPRLEDFTDKSWDELSDSEKRSIAGHFAWAPKMPPERFTDLKLPHHDPKTHAVVWRGVVAAMAALFGARGGVDIPAEDRRKVYNHLAQHYREFGKEPPDFKFLEEFVIQLEHLKSLISAEKNMESELENKVKELEAENKKLREEIDNLKAKLAEYEEKEKSAIIEKIKNVAKITKTEIDEEKLKSANVIELKLLYADLADKALSVKTKAEKLEIKIDEEPEIIETKFGRINLKKYNELRKMVGLEEVKSDA